VIRKAGVGTHVLVLVRATTRTANARMMNDEGMLVHHSYCYCHHHHHPRRRCYKPHCCRAASYASRTGPVGPRRQKVDSEMASPFLSLLGRSSGMGDAGRERERPVVLALSLALA